VKNLDTFNDFINEGVNDPGILKAFFMAGGPGSGKSFVAAEIFGFPKEAVSSVSYRTGLKLVNNDNAFEAGLKKYGLSAGELANYAKDEEKWAEVMKIRDKSKGLTKRMQDNYISGRLGQVIDGTGKNFNKIRGHREMYQDFGYDTYMVFVNTSLEIALERNRTRERRLPDTIVEKMWKEVQDNLGKFSRLFGKQNMIIVDNSSYEDSAKILAHIEKEISRRVKLPVKNYLGLRWIEDQRNPDKNQPMGYKKKAGQRR
jgi:predicted kinase